MKVDLVYLWCDSHDEKFLKKKEKYLKKFGKNLDIQASTSARWQDNDELKYSLRSVEKFIPWINHIYIVTDDQVPQWLDTSNPKITIVDHKDIIPKKYLPTFNSNIIEVYLPYIKNLSEHFLYANDDMFFNDYLKKDYFFNTKDNKPIVNVKKSKFKNRKESLYSRLLYNLNIKINKNFNTNYMIEDSHNIIPYRKSFLIDNLNDKFCKDDFKNMLSSTFRKETDVQRFIHVLLDNVKERNILRYTNNKNIFQKIFNKITGKYDYDFLYISKHTENIKKYKPRLFCINDSDALTDKDRKKNKEFLKTYFPVKSKFEK